MRTNGVGSHAGSDSARGCAVILFDGSKPRCLATTQCRGLDGGHQAGGRDPRAPSRRTAVCGVNHSPLVLTIRCQLGKVRRHALLELAKLVPVEPRGINAAGPIESHHVIGDPLDQGGGPIHELDESICDAQATPSFWERTLSAPANR